MRELKKESEEKQENVRNEGDSGIPLKGLQYLMLVLLFAAVFYLPRYAVGKMAREEIQGSAAWEASDSTPGVPNAPETTQFFSNTEKLEGNEDDSSQTGAAERNITERSAAGENTAGENAAGENTAGENAAGGNATEPEADTAEHTGKGTIVIDGGHGGDDPGMIGISGVKEKELNLIYAKKLEELLVQAGYRVVQTRETDAGLYDESQSNKKAQDMQRRCAIIEEEQPLLTVSIHQNSYPQDASVRGPQVFYYEHSTEGEKLAKSIQDSMNAQLQIERPRVHKGNGTYYILKRSSGVTVIVECGFLTNPEEEVKLQEEDYQNRIVQAVCDGVLAYLGDV